jgi:hypothetical protein
MRREYLKWAKRHRFSGHSTVSHCCRRPVPAPRSGALTRELAQARDRRNSSLRRVAAKDDVLLRASRSQRFSLSTFPTRRDMMPLRRRLNVGGGRRSQHRLRHEIERGTVKCLNLDLFEAAVSMPSRWFSPVLQCRRQARTTATEYATWP